MPPALVLETSCLRVNLRVTVKSGPYNNKEKDHQITYLCKRGKKKKNNQKVDHFKNDCNHPWGKKMGKHILTCKKKYIQKAFLKKKIF